MKSPTRVPSTTKQTSTDRDKEIEDLRNQIKLKRNQKKNMIRKSNLHILSQKKQTQVASASGGHTQTNIDLLKVLNFVQETMQTLSNYSEQL